MKPVNLLVVLICLISLKVFSQNIELADDSFNKKDFDKARIEYIKAASMGNVRAYYRLADIYLHGLGREKDQITAILWLSLASEYDYRESKKILAKLLSGFNQTQLTIIDTARAAFIEKRGKEQVSNLYEPEILKDNLAHKILFSESEGLDIDTSFTNESFDDDFNSTIDIANEMLGAFVGLDTIDEDDGLSEQKDYNEYYYLVAEYDVAPDGSVRNIEPIQLLGNGEQRHGVFALASYDFTPPTFAKTKVYKSQRAYLGAASFDNRRFRQSHKTVYSQIKRQVAKFKNSDLAMDKYQYAKALMNFPFLPREEGQVEQLLMTAIKADIPMAKLELGLKLYREQSDIKEGIYWITEAAKQGITEAEYRLARLFVESPWVKPDEHKAQKWFKSAVEKQHTHAIRKYAELQLFANDKSLLNPDQAFEQLKVIETLQQENPQFYYLLARAASLSTQETHAVAVKQLKQAIHLAKFYNWPTNEWNNLLKNWTRGGKVSIQDI